MLSEFGPWEKASVIQTQRTKATQRDLCNHILVLRSNGMDMFPTPQPQNWQFMSPVRQVTLLLVGPWNFCSRILSFPYPWSVHPLLLASFPDNVSFSGFFVLLLFSRMMATTCHPSLCVRAAKCKMCLLWCIAVFFRVGPGRVIFNVDLSLGYLSVEGERLLC